MTPTIKTLTAVAALTLAAGGAMAQDRQTVPLAQPGDAAVTAPETGTTFVVKPDGTRETLTAGETAATEAGADAAEATTEAAEEATDAPAADTTEAEAAEAPAADEATAETTEAAASDAATDEAAAPETADAATDEAPAADEAAEPAADEAAAPEATDEAAEPEAADEATQADATAEEAPAGEAEATEAEATDAAAAEAAGDEAATGEAGAADAAHEGEAHAEGEGGEAHADAGSHESHITNVAFSFEGPFGTYDQHQLQRGLQVYTDVCSSCHGLRYVPIRTLSDETGPGLPEDQVRAYAAGLSKIDPETEEEVPREPADNFPYIPHKDGMGPDLSLMAKARAGFHGPYGTGINQLINGIGGPEYIYSVLTGYTGETKEEAGTTFYGNTAFPGGWIAMPPPLDDGTLDFQDGHPNDLASISKEISAFLMWTAEPKMMQRKQMGLVAVTFLLVLTMLLYLTNKKLWTPHKHPRKDS